MSTKVGITAENYQVSENVERDTADAVTGLNTQQEESDGLKIHGLALPFGKRSRNGVVYEKSSVKEAAESLIGCSLLFNHDENNPLGHIEDVEIKEDGLYYVGDLNEEKTETESLKRGDIPHVSIQATIEETAQTAKNGEVGVKEFLEMSAVTVPGFSSTDVEAEETVMIEKLIEGETKSIESLDNPEFDVGDFVRWQFGEGSAEGEITDMETEVGGTMSAGGNTFEIEEGDEPLYKIQEWDDQETEFTNNVVKFEDALNEVDRPDEAPDTAPRNETSGESSNQKSSSKELFEFEPVPTHVLYNDKNDALQRAKDLGLAEVHKHVMQDQEFWMAGANHEEWKMAVQDELSGSNDGQESTSKEPFADYDDFEDCVSDNQDKRDPEAYCAAIKRQVEEDGEVDKVKLAKKRLEINRKFNQALSDVDLTPPDVVQNAAQAGLDAKEKFEDEIGDCGTGVGESRARSIVNETLSPEDFLGGDKTAIPDYLDSHSEDVNGIDQPPTDWSEETWTDGCGPVQYALWGGTATGTGLDWANRTEQQLRDAKEKVKQEILSGENTTMTESTTTEQLEEVNESDFHGTVADMYEGLDASDVAQLMEDFEFSDDPEPLVAQVADLANMTPPDLMEVLEVETEGTDGDMDDDEEDEAGDMDDDEEEDESFNKNEEQQESSQSGDNSMDENDEEKSKEELRSEIEELKEAVRKLEDTEDSKQETGALSGEGDEGVLSDEFKNRIKR